MPNIGPLELLVVLIIALLVLGPKRLPEAGRSVGRGIREFKDAVSGNGRDADRAAGALGTPSQPEPGATSMERRPT